MRTSIPVGKRFLPDVTIQQLESLQNKSEKYKRHYTAAIRRKEGLSMREIADDVNVSVSAVSMWLQNMMTRGIGEDYEIKRGRPPKLTPEQLNQLSVDMREPPVRYGLDSATWVSRTVAQYVLQKFGISITPGSMRRILVRKHIDWPGSAEVVGRMRDASPEPKIKKKDD